MEASPENKAILDKIESSSFVVCLDDSKPVTRDEGSRACWHGDGRNRFFDKPLQFIVFDNGKAGFMGEVSGAGKFDVSKQKLLFTYACDFVSM